MIKQVNTISPSQKYFKFSINGQLVGKIPHPKITSAITDLDHNLLKSYVVDATKKTIHLRTSEFEVSNRLNDLANLIYKNRPELIPGWRGEQYPIFSPDSLVKVKSPEKDYIGSVERAAADSIFGVEKFGAHLTIFKNSGELKILIAKRAANKSKYPGYWDNAVAGGINVETTPSECIKKEAFEEAGIIDEQILEKIREIGTTSHCSSKSCFSKSIQYNYELDVSEFENFEAEPTDGEVESFKFCSVNEVLDLLVSGNFKPISAIVTVQFLIQKGVLDVENTECFHEIVKGLNNY